MSVLNPKITLIVLVVVLITSNLYAQSKTELLKKKQALQREIENTNKVLTETQENKDVTMKQLRTLGSQVETRQKLIETINTQVKNLSYEISDNKHNISSLQKEEDKLKIEYAGMIRYAYRNQSAYNKLMFIFAASSFNQAYNRLKYLEQFSQYRREQVQTITSTQEKIHGKIQVLDKNKDDKDQLLGEQQKEKKQLDVEKGQQAHVYSQLQKQSKKLEAQLARHQRDLRRLNNAIQSAIRREIEEARRRAEQEARAREAANATATTHSALPKSTNSSANLVLTPEAARLSNQFADNRGSLPWPVERRGRIIDPFGIHEDPLLPRVKINSVGIVFETVGNATVRAVFSGEVSEIVPLDGLYAVLIRHGEYFTVYGNLKSVEVKRGQKVSTKDPVGVVAADEEQGPSCMFQVWKGKTPMNPTSWLAN